VERGIRRPRRMMRCMMIDRQRRVDDIGIPGFESRNALEANLEYVDGGIASHAVVIGSPRQRCSGFGR
jgi:hypothetical protein